MTDELEVEEQEEPNLDQEEPQELIFGKYKTLEEAGRAHKDLERQFHASRQPAPAEEPPDYGYVQPPQGPATAAEAPDPNEAFYENPAGFVVQTVAQIRHLERIANANRRAALKELRSHPAYDTISDELDNMLDMTDPAYLADPNQARQVIRAMFGERLLERTQTAPRTERRATKQPPAQQESRRSAQEIEVPDSGDEGDQGPQLDTEGEELLRSLGLAARSRKSVAGSWATRQQEERGK